MRFKLELMTQQKKEYEKLFGEERKKYDDLAEAV
jgi:hypothetical protein